MNRSLTRVAVTVAAATALGAGCSAPGPAGPEAASSPPGTSAPAAPDSTTPGQIELPTVAPVTPTAGAGVPSGIPAAAPAPDPTPATYADPVLVAQAWMRQFCQTDYQEPINANLTRAAVFATVAATAADTARGDTPDTYQQVREQKLSARCDHVAALVNPEAPASPTSVYVQVSATSTQLADGAPFQTLPLSSTRRIVREADGRWLVDAEVDAG